MPLNYCIHRICVSELTDHVYLISAAAASLIHVHRVTTRECWHVGLVIRVTKDVQIVHLDNFNVVFNVSSIF